MTTPIAISDLENEVMQIIWSTDVATAEQIQIRLAPKRPLKDSTIRTVLRRLEQKGFLVHSVEGRTFVYKAALARERAVGRSLRQLIDRVCGGSVETLLVGMVNDRLCTREHLQRLAKKIAAQKK